MTCDGFPAGARRGSGFDLRDAVSYPDRRFVHCPDQTSGKIALTYPALQRLATGGAKGSSAGFTFVELLIVVAIISILAAIAMPAYRAYLLRSKVAEGLVFLGDARNSVNEFYSRWGRMPADNGEAGLRQPDDLSGKYVRSLNVHDGVMVASLDLGKDSDSQPIIRTLTFRPWVNTQSRGNPIIWSCGLQDPEVSSAYQAQGEVAENPVEDSLLPTVCRNPG